jgi:hypothetical protein
MWSALLCRRPLDIAGRKIDAGRDPGDHGCGLRLGDLARAAADNHRDLTLIVHLPRRFLRQRNAGPGTHYDPRTRLADAEHQVARDGDADFGGVGLIVEANEDQSVRRQRRQKDLVDGIDWSARAGAQFAHAIGLNRGVQREIALDQRPSVGTGADNARRGLKKLGDTHWVETPISGQLLSSGITQIQDCWWTT